MKLPAKLGLPGTRTRFDELQASHSMQAELTHGVVSNQGFLSEGTIYLHL